MSDLLTTAPAAPSDADAPASRRELLGLPPQDEAMRQFDATLERLEYAGIIEVKTEPAEDPFHDPDAPPPLTDDEADWLIDRLASFDERERRIKAQAEAMCKDIDRQRRGVLHKHETALREWTASKIRGKSRSIKRLVGTIGFRTVPGRMTVHRLDYDRALEWAKANLPAAVKETVDLAQIKPVEAIHPDTGEICTGPPATCFQWQPPRDSFFVKGSRIGTEGDSDE